MKILMVHNSYQQAGGEDAVVAAESRELESHGHTVIQFRRHNDELKNINPFVAITKGIETIWSSRSFNDITKSIRDAQPEIVHVHNTFPLISPSVYYACAQEHVPVVQTLHNYRLLCPAATLLRDGVVCEACTNHFFPWSGVLHSCYRGSRFQTAAAGFMLAAHRMLRTWHNKVRFFIALSEFARKKFSENGLPPDRIVVKPNFVKDDPGPKATHGDYALYVGRLSEEKGLRTLLGAWQWLPRTMRLRLVGDGPLRKELIAIITKYGLRNVILAGNLPPSEVRERMRNARFLICPSIWFEGFPLIVAEAYACGLPIIASRIGTLAEIVNDGKTGLHFVPGDEIDLARKVEWAWKHPDEIQQMGQEARAEYLRKFTAEHNYHLLVDIYENALRSPFPQPDVSAH